MLTLNLTLIVLLNSYYVYILQVIVFGDKESAAGNMTFQTLVETSDGQYTTPAGNPKKDVAALMSSSGTTGFPKAVLVSHYAIVANTLIQQ